MCRSSIAATMSMSMVERGSPAQRARDRAADRVGNPETVECASHGPRDRNGVDGLRHGPSRAATSGKALPGQFRFRASRSPGAAATRAVRRPGSDDVPGEGQIQRGLREAGDGAAICSQDIRRQPSICRCSISATCRAQEA